jgi:hypothetical protein
MPRLYVAEGLDRQSWHLACATVVGPDMEIEMTEQERKGDDHEMPEFPAQRDDSPYASYGEGRGAPGGARHHVRSQTEQGAAARPGGATQNSGGALQSNTEELGHGPGRGAD